MKLSTFGSYTLPKTRVETLVPTGQFATAYNQADEEDGPMPTMGSGSMPLDTLSFAATFMIDRGFLKLRGYDLDEGGMDTALYDFAVNVLQAGLQTLTAVPSGGTTPKAGLSGLGITSWTFSAQAFGSYSGNRHVGGAQAYAEIPITLLVPSGTWVVHLVGGSSVTVPIL